MYILKDKKENKLYYSKGANKIAQKVGKSASTITRHFAKTSEPKVIEGYIISKPIPLENKNRGKCIKRSV